MTNILLKKMEMVAKKLGNEMAMGERRTIFINMSHPRTAYGISRG